MSTEHDPALTYASYLAVDELLQLQRPLSDGPEHDELLFIVIHQTYELWFKQLLHELIAAKASLESGDTYRSMAILGRRDSKMAGHLPKADQDRIALITANRSLWDSTLVYLAKRGHAVPAEYLDRDFSQHYTSNSGVQDLLVDVHHNDPESAMLCERLVDIDEGLQEWRYRHVKMVERTIGAKIGTGGSSGVGYLSSTLFNPIFPDLWAIRDRF